MTAPAPNPKAIYHVRLVQPWPPSGASTSFFGLRMELHGFAAGSAPTNTPVTLPMEFGGPSATNGNAAQPSPLSLIVGPFQVLVQAKLSPEDAGISQEHKALLHHVILVQPGNSFFEINGIPFLSTCQTGLDVYRQLRRVFDKVCLAKPFELTFARHNLEKATAKIVPFARRPDVQAVQLAQFQRMQQQDAALSSAVKHKKQFLIQQMDYEREFYLLRHIGMKLHDLHEEIMANAQWQAFEFDRVLWYYNSTSAELFAEHPMRSNPDTRQLIGNVQFKLRFAINRIQRMARLFLQTSALVNKVINDPRLQDDIWNKLWSTSWDDLWQSQLVPCYREIEPLLAVAPLDTNEEANLLCAIWKARLRSPGFRPAQNLASPSKKPQQTTSDAMTNTDAPNEQTVEGTQTTPRPVIVAVNSEMQTLPGSNHASPRIATTIETNTDAVSIVAAIQQTTSATQMTPRAESSYVEMAIQTLLVGNTLTPRRIVTTAETSTEAIAAAVVREQAIKFSQTTPQHSPRDQMTGCTQTTPRPATSDQVAVVTQLTPQQSSSSQMTGSTQTTPRPLPCESSTGATQTTPRPLSPLQTAGFTQTTPRPAVLSIESGIQTEAALPSNDGDHRSSEWRNHLHLLKTTLRRKKSPTKGTQTEKWEPPGPRQWMDCSSNEHLHQLKAVSSVRQPATCTIQNSQPHHTFHQPVYTSSTTQRECKNLPIPVRLRHAEPDPFERQDSRYRRALETLLAPDYDQGEHEISRSTTCFVPPPINVSGWKQDTNYLQNSQRYQEAINSLQQAGIIEDSPAYPRRRQSPPIKANGAQPIYLQMMNELAPQDRKANAKAAAASPSKLPYITRRKNPAR